MRYKEIKLLFVDIDGCLTDGIYQISDSGSIIKSFYTRDWYGIEQLLKKNIKVIILSQSHDEVIYKQVERICSHSNFWHNAYENDKTLEIITKIDNKEEEVKKQKKYYDLEWNNIAYIGDAENDIESMKLAVFSASPKDAILDVSKVSNYFSSYGGGRGAVHDICRHILENIERETRYENSKT